MTWPTAWYRLLQNFSKISSSAVMACPCIISYCGIIGAASGVGGWLYHRRVTDYSSEGSVRMDVL